MISLSAFLGATHSAKDAVLRQVDRRVGLTKALAKRLPDQRGPDKIERSLDSMLRRRIYGLAKI